jgi:hypothetical protein
MPAGPKAPDPIKTCFYSPWFAPLEKRWLKKSSPDGCDEVYNLRSLAGRLTAHLSRKEPGEYSDADLKLLTTLVRISVGIGALLRGNASLAGREGRLDQSIERAIESLEGEWSQA